MSFAIATPSLYPHVCFRFVIVICFYVSQQPTNSRQDFGTTPNLSTANKYQNKTKLSKYIWNMNGSNRPHKIKWGIIKKIKGRNKIKKIKGRYQ